MAAWKQLGALREPHKLRSWLCQIARNLTCGALKKQGREPSSRGESLAEISASPAPEASPLEQTISHEEAAILWRSLERMPLSYREPLVLFYRGASVDRGGRGESGIDRGRGEAAIVPWSKAAAGAGARLHRRRAGADESWKSFYHECIGRVAGADHFRQSGYAGRGARRKEVWRPRRREPWACSGRWPVRC